MLHPSFAYRKTNKFELQQPSTPPPRSPKFPPGLLGPYPPTLAGMAADIQSYEERGDQEMVNGVFYTTPGHQGLNDLLRDNFIINVYNNRY